MQDKLEFEHFPHKYVRDRESIDNFLTSQGFYLMGEVEGSSRYYFREKNSIKLRILKGVSAYRLYKELETDIEMVFDKSDDIDTVLFEKTLKYFDEISEKLK